MGTQYRCNDERRRELVRDMRDAHNQRIVNGIDFLEVDQNDPTKLCLQFIHDIKGGTQVPADADTLTEDNILIEGGVRVRNVTAFHVGFSNAKGFRVDVNVAGDYSEYRLRIVQSRADPRPRSGFDPLLSEIVFSFKVDCLNEFDCLPQKVCPPADRPEPPIDYLAKDYASFRRLMMDRLAFLMPETLERNPADSGVAIVEALAYSADELSYFQDAVATEAYLGTARKRISVRRHARLLDYPIREGCNARAFVFFRLATAVPTLDMKEHTPLLTKTDGLKVAVDLRSDELEEFTANGAEVFETMHSATLRVEHNEILLHTWGMEDCCLPKGATRATLRNDDGRLARLRPGDWLLFEETRSPEDGTEGGADPTHRQVVRLVRIDPGEDPLVRDPGTDAPLAVLEVKWSEEDALRFPLCVKDVDDPRNPGKKAPVSVARGNLVLADHGHTREREQVGPVPAKRPFRPRLQAGPLTVQRQVPIRTRRTEDLAPFDPAGSAHAAIERDAEEYRPSITLTQGGLEEFPWKPQRDLLASGRFAQEFVVEVDDDGRGRLRFGDGWNGRKPSENAVFRADYRVGNGRAGNVGAESIAHVITDPGTIEVVRNPLPATGGTEAETLEEVLRYAPYAFRIQERAVTEADYSEMALRHPDVQRAVTTVRWTGSWYTFFVTVDRKGGREVDAAFKEELREFLGRYRLAGHDVEVEAPQFVSLDIVMSVCVAPGYYRSDVKAALLEVFSNRDLPGGGRGFFHPDRFTFGQDVYLSVVTTAALRVPGVAWVDLEDRAPKPTRFRRWGQLPRGEFEMGRIPIGRLEIARLDNDPNAQEKGRIAFLMEGGL